MIVKDASIAQTASISNFTPLVGAGLPQTTETNLQEITLREAGTTAKWYFVVSANTRSDSSTCKSRKNRADGVQTITIATTLTGEFQDPTNSDTITAADEYDADIVTGGGTGTLTWYVVSTLFTATTDTVTKTGIDETFGITTASNTSFRFESGLVDANNTTEANAKSRQRKVGTIKSMCTVVRTNGRSTNSTLSSRLNGAAGTLTETITNGVTGIFEDTTHSDTVAVADDWCFQSVTGTGVGTLRYNYNTVSFISTADVGILQGGYVAGGTVNANLNQFDTLAGDIFFQTGVEDFTNRYSLRDSFTLSELYVFVTANTVTLDSTFKSRKNSADGSLTTTITASTTGNFNDGTHTESDISTDLLNVNLITGATGTSMTVRSNGVYTTQSAAVVSVRPRAQAFNLSPYLTMNLGPRIDLGVSNLGGL